MHSIDTKDVKKGGEIMSEKNEEKTEVKVDQIKEAVVKFKDDLGALVKDLQLDVDTWRFSVESEKEVVKVDVAFTLTIKKKSEQKE
jgi:hypothetical protein